MTSTGSIIYLEDVTVSYDGFKALSRLNFYMDRRELRVVIGPNGAGKTTLLDVISGRAKPEHGRVIFGDHTDLLPLAENDVVGLGIGRKFQTPSVFVNLSVWDNVELSLKRASKGVFSALLEHDGARGQGVAAGRRPVARGEAVARDRHGDGAGSGAAAGGRAGGGHDRRGDGADRRAAGIDRRRPLGARHRARHGVRATDRPEGHRAASGHGAVRRPGGAGPVGSARARGLPRAPPRDGRCSRLSGSMSPTAARRCSGASTSRSPRAKSSA